MSSKRFKLLWENTLKVFIAAFFFSFPFFFASMFLVNRKAELLPLKTAKETDSDEASLSQKHETTN